MNKKKRNVTLIKRFPQKQNIRDKQGVHKIKY